MQLNPFANSTYEPLEKLMKLSERFLTFCKNPYSSYVKTTDTTRKFLTVLRFESRTLLNRVKKTALMH